MKTGPKQPTRKPKPRKSKAAPSKALSKFAIKRPVGHPPLYTKELAAEVCRRISRGEYLEDIEKIDGMPCADTIHGWVVDDKDGFFGAYMRARKVQALSKIDECEKIADASGLDFHVDELTGKVTVNGEVVRRAELRIKTRQWVQERVYQTVFGQKMDVTSGGAPLTGQDARDYVATRLAKAAALREIAGG